MFARVEAIKAKEAEGGNRGAERMGFKDYGFGYRNVIPKQRNSGTFIFGKNHTVDLLLINNHLHGKVK
jgi:hypothetical protein